MTQSSKFSSGSAAAQEPRIQWATSRRVGNISELAVLAPIKEGCPPGERRTYEERLRGIIANLAKRHEQGMPTELDRVTTIHFGRMLIIRPEQYLWYSRLNQVDYEPSVSTSGPDIARQIPLPIDDFREIVANEDPRPDSALRSWLLVLVEFDGDLKVYMRDIFQFTGLEFDRIFYNCEEYPGADDFDMFWSWIRCFQLPTDLFYSTYANLSVVRLKQLETFKRRFDAFVATVRSPTGPRVESMDELFDAFLRENQHYAAGFPAVGGTYPAEKLT